MVGVIERVRAAYRAHMDGRPGIGMLCVFGWLVLFIAAVVATCGVVVGLHLTGVLS